jgi:hypothetical protein
MRRSLLICLGLALAGVITAAQGDDLSRWWFKLDDPCFLYGQWSSGAGPGGGPYFTLLFGGDARQGPYRVEKWDEGKLASRFYGDYVRNDDRLELHYCDPCDGGQAKVYTFAWTIQGMGTIETDFPDEMTIVGTADQASGQFPEMKRLMGDSPLHLTRDTLFPPIVDDIFPADTDKGEDVRQRWESCVNQLHWRRLRPRD